MCVIEAVGAWFATTVIETVELVAAPWSSRTVSVTG